LTLILFLRDPKTYLIIEVEVSPEPPRLPGLVAPPHYISNHKPLDLVHPFYLYLLLPVSLGPLPLPYVSLLLLLSEPQHLPVLLRLLPVELPILRLYLLLLLLLPRRLLH
jgi:hypothetical protein